MKRYVSGALFLLLGACSSATDVSRSYCGVYQGILPAASGPGIEVTLRLDKDYGFVEKDVYLDEQDGTFYNQGRYFSKGRKIRLKSSDGMESYYLVEEGQLRRLDLEGRMITGVLADNYILKEISSCLTN